MAPTRIAFIGSGGTASASELVINESVPYLDSGVGLIGGNTYGKPVGQIAVDNTACDDRLRIIVFATQNSVHTGDYYGGLAPVMRATCQAVDDLSHAMGDPQEALTRQALDFIVGRTCTPIATATARSLGVEAGRRDLLSLDRPGTAQREVPGLF
ncbi:MAG TPA: hypothetical protein VF503_10105 [Sphingobium sp.]|uniref:hypothetical protein n=1 Tax=Sphingobium sp. TaxID=1912891 RepID=UPI002ED4B66E